MCEHVACIANQGKAIGDNPPDNLHDKNTACYGARQDQPFPFMRPVLVFMAMLVFDVVIVYAVNMFDDFSPVKLKRTQIFADIRRKHYVRKILIIVRLSTHDEVCVHLRPMIIQIINL